MSVLIAQVITHIVAFTLLFLILKKFAWGPVTALLDERRKIVEGDLADADRKAKEADALKKQYEERLRKIDEEARTRLNQAIEEGTRISTELKAQASTEAKDVIEKARATAKLEVEQARLELRNKTVGLTIKATEKLLREKYDDQKHRDMVNRFVEELEAKRA